MNFLLGASLIILLLFPGAVFRMAYYSSRHGRGFSFSLFEALVISIIPTAVIHLCCMPLTKGYHLDFSKLYLIIISEKSGATAVTMSSISGFLQYCLLTYGIAGAAGLLLQKIAMVFDLDINIPIFRIHNEWYYQLRGRIVPGSMIGFRRFLEVNSIHLDALVDIGGEGYLYSGTIDDFILSKDEGVDRIFLIDVIRRKLINEKSFANEKTYMKAITEDDMQQLLEDTTADISQPEVTKQLEKIIAEDDEFVPGTSLCLLFKDIKNLNLTYLIAVEATV